MRRLLQAVVLSVLATVLSATTLELLSSSQLVQQATQIVRGKVSSSSAVQRGSMIYTVLHVQVSESIKGTAVTASDIYLPGGTLNGRRQVVAGTPNVTPGQDYVFFVWTSPKGIPHLLGLSQGVFQVSTSASGTTLLSRPPIEGVEMVDSTGNSQTDAGLKMTLSGLKSKVQQVAAAPSQGGVE